MTPPADCSEVQSEVERLIPEQNSTLVFVGDRTESVRTRSALLRTLL